MGAGQERLDLVEQPLGVAGVPEVVLAWKLDQPGVRDVRGQVACVAVPDVAIIGAVEQQGGRPDAAHDSGEVAAVEDSHDRPRCGWPPAQAFAAHEPAPKRGFSGAAGRQPVGVRPRPDLRYVTSRVLLGDRGGQPPGVIRAAREPGKRGDQHELGHAGGVCRREQHRGQGHLRCRHEYRSGAARRVHHQADVVHPGVRTCPCASSAGVGPSPRGALSLTGRRRSFPAPDGAAAKGSSRRHAGVIAIAPTLDRRTALLSLERGKPSVRSPLCMSPTDALREVAFARAVKCPVGPVWRGRRAAPLGPAVPPTRGCEHATYRC